MARDMGKSDKDRDVAAWLRESQEAFAGFEVESWLAWGGSTLLKDYAARVEQKARVEAIAMAKARIEAQYQAEVLAWEVRDRERVEKMEAIKAAFKGKFEELKVRRIQGGFVGEEFKSAVVALNAEQEKELAKWPAEEKPSAPDASDGEEEVNEALQPTQASTDTQKTEGTSRGGRLAAARVPTKRKSSDAMRDRVVKGRSEPRRVSRS
jgi:hypothetical protein